MLLSDSFDFDLNCFLCENRTSSSSRLDEKPVRLWAFLHCVMWWLQPWDGSARCPITASLPHTLRIPHFTAAAAAAVHSHLSHSLDATHLPCLSTSPFFRTTPGVKKEMCHVSGGKCILPLQPPFPPLHWRQSSAENPVMGWENQSNCSFSHLSNLPTV